MNPRRFEAAASGRYGPTVADRTDDLNDAVRELIDVVRTADLSEVDLDAAIAQVMSIGDGLRPHVVPGLRMQATLMAERAGSRWYPKLRAGNSLQRTERVCSQVLGGPIRVVITPYGGLSLDADNEDDFRVLNTRFEEWISVPPAE